MPHSSVMQTLRILSMSKVYLRRDDEIYLFFLFAFYLDRKLFLVMDSKNSLDCVKQFALMVWFQGLTGLKGSSDILHFIFVVIPSEAIFHRLINLNTRSLVGASIWEGHGKVKPCWRMYISVGECWEHFLNKNLLQVNKNTMHCI